MVIERGSVNSVVRVSRMIMDYFGLDTELFIQDWVPEALMKKRSIVRVIGTILPLKPCKRAYFKITLNESVQSIAQKRDWKPVFFDEDSDPLVVPSLVDLKWIVNESPDKRIRGRSEIRPIKSKRSKRKRRPRPSNIILPALASTPIPEHDMHVVTNCSINSSPALDESAINLSSSTSVNVSSVSSDPGALQKINVLEEELAKLRAQIALIITVQAQQPATPMTPCGIPTLSATCMDTPPLTPQSGVAAPPPPPPPPPPPLPLTQSRLVPKKNKACNPEKRSRPAPSVPSMGDLLKGLGSVKLRSTASNPVKRSRPAPSVPSMGDVLKGLGSVKLRSTARSPGGTPLRRAPKPADNNDPASLIAQALRKKFAHRRAMESPDKENSVGSTPSPKSSPMFSKNSPIKFGPHLLKPVSHHASDRQRTTPLAEVNI